MVTPEIEMDLCGHATLATAHCLKEIYNYFNDFINFHTTSGEISVKFKNGKYQMSLPKRVPQVSDLPDIISRSLNIQPLECYKLRDYVLVYHSENDINNIIVDKKILDKINLDPGGVVVTSKEIQLILFLDILLHNLQYWKTQPPAHHIAL